MKRHWKIYLCERCVGEVWYDETMSAEQVKQALIESAGFHQYITVKEVV